MLPRWVRVHKFQVYLANTIFSGSYSIWRADATKGATCPKPLNTQINSLEAGPFVSARYAAVQQMPGTFRRYCASRTQCTLIPAIISQFTNINQIPAGVGFFTCKYGTATMVQNHRRLTHWMATKSFRRKCGLIPWRCQCKYEGVGFSLHTVLPEGLFIFYMFFVYHTKNGLFPFKDSVKYKSPHHKNILLE